MGIKLGFQRRRIGERAGQDVLRITLRCWSRSMTIGLQSQLRSCTGGSHGRSDRYDDGLAAFRINVYGGPRIQPGEEVAMQNLGRYIIRAPFSQNLPASPGTGPNGI